MPTAYQILVILALLFAVASLIKPSWPLAGVGLLLVCVAMLIGKGGP